MKMVVPMAAQRVVDLVVPTVVSMVEPMVAQTAVNLVEWKAHSLAVLLGLKLVARWALLRVGLKVDQTEQRMAEKKVGSMAAHLELKWAAKLAESMVGSKAATMVFGKAVHSAGHSVGVKGPLLAEQTAEKMAVS